MDLDSSLMLCWHWGWILRSGLWSGRARGVAGGGCGGGSAIEAVSQVLKKAPSDRRLESRETANLASALTESCPELVEHVWVCSRRHRYLLALQILEMLHRHL